MNAYELADYLEVSPNMNVFKASTMLRQQADKIAELEKQSELLKNSINFVILAKKLQTNLLSDFEIKEVMAQDKCWIGEDCSAPDLIRFARAIETKVRGRK